ncbi:MAG: hypothetical protein EPN84_02650 [Legionella sp.]|nr:MAG: hypothetical protein EPN84_02650 [Legionella sp.]
MSTLEQLEGLVSAKIGAIKDLFTLIKLEAQLARLSIFPLILNLCLLFVILIGLWFSLMLLLGTGIYYVWDNLVIAIFGVFLVNLLAAFGLFKYLNFNVRNISFTHTRAYFASTESTSYDRIEKTTDSTDCSN